MILDKNFSKELGGGTHVTPQNDDSNSPSGFGGFFKRCLATVKKWVVDKNTFGPFVGAIVGSIMEMTGANSYSDGAAPLFRTAVPTDFTPNVIDETVSDNWLVQKFTPFFNNMLKQLDAGMKSSDLAVQIGAINVAKIKMYAVLQYMLKHPLSGISSTGAQSLHNSVENFFIVANNVIAQHLQTDSQTFSTATATVTVDPNDFLPLQMERTTHQVEIYTIVDEDDDGTLVSTPIVGTTAGGTVISAAPTTATTTTTNTNANNTDDNRGKRLLFMGAAALGIYLLFKPKKAKASAAANS